MQRRDLLRFVGSAALVRLGAGCDKFVLLEEGPRPGLPAITPNDKFYVYSCCGLPDLDPATHETVLLHEDAELGRFSLADLEALPAREKEHTLECIGAQPRIQNISNAIWTGLPLIEVLDALGVEVPESAVGLRLVGMDDYHAGIPIEDLVGETPLWIVWRMNDEPLPFEHGAPARLLVPGRYGVKNLKWLKEIAFVDTPHVSFWTENGGWSEEATYRPNTFVVSPLEGTPVRDGERVRVLGTAFAGPDPVERVEVRIDDGPWMEATLDYQTHLPDLWVLWSFEWLAEKGDHTIQARCITASGEQSVEDPDGTNRLDGYDGSMQIALEVRS
jgi:DMSO/TMAO reductase YedYZ molybdopterin-dependent catalytic subunit